MAYKKNKNYLKNLSSAMKYKYQHKKNLTTAEKKFKAILDDSGIKYNYQKILMLGDSFIIADFYLPKPHKLVIEIDGEYHQERKNKDMLRDYHLENQRKMKTKRFTNKQILEKPEEVLKEINKIINFS